MRSGQYAEEAMLVAALEEDDRELERLVEDTTPSERIALTRAMNRLYDALAKKSGVI